MRPFFNTAYTIGSEAGEPLQHAGCSPVLVPLVTVTAPVCRGLRELSEREVRHDLFTMSGPYDRQFVHWYGRGHWPAAIVGVAIRQCGQVTDPGIIRNRPNVLIDDDRYRSRGASAVIEQIAAGATSLLRPMEEKVRVAEGAKVINAGLDVVNQTDDLLLVFQLALAINLRCHAWGDADARYDAALRFPMPEAPQ